MTRPFAIPNPRRIDLASVLWDAQHLGRSEKKADTLATLGLADFIPMITPSYTAPLHLFPVVRELEKAVAQPTTTTKPLRLIISLPPRHGKTETVLHFIAWYLRQLSAHTIGYVSYAQTQAGSKALKAQRYTMRAGVAPDVKMQNRAEWRTAEGGGILSTGIGGPLTGQGVNGLIIDDPVKNREEANSAAVRAKQWDWFLDVAETRLEPGGWMLVVMTRWHRDDLAGRIMANFKDDYTVLRIPALADGLDAAGREAAPDLAGRSVGAALWSERYNAEYLERVKAKNPLGFYSLYQGLPRPKEEYAFGQPTYYTELPTDGVRYGIGGDLAYTIKTHSDHSVTVVMAECNGVFYVVNVLRWRSRLMASIEYLRGIQEKYPFTGITLEDNGPQTAVCDMLEENGIYVNRLQPVGDKYTRSLPLAEAWNAGLVRVPEGAVWLDAYLEELMSFTGINDAADDQVDASVYAFRSLQTMFSFHT